MAHPDVLNPHPREFERFLYAPVGEDRNGFVVTVLSTFARLGLDPWAETEDLITLGRDAARVRLAMLLARFGDVPALARDHRKVAGDLTQLLPDGPGSPTMTQRAAGTLAGGQVGIGGLILAAAALVVLLIQVFATFGPGSGE